MKRALIILVIVVLCGPVTLHAQHVVKITASDGRLGKGFGYSVAISGDVVIIGTRWERAAYVYERRDGQWQEQTKLEPSDVLEDELFGRSVSVSGDHAVVGATRMWSYPGAVYIFERRDDTWVKQDKWNGHDATEYFGELVAIDGTLIVAGEHRDRRIRIFSIRNEGDALDRQRSLQMFDLFRGYQYIPHGFSLSASGKHIVVGNWQETYLGDILASQVVSIEQVDDVWRLAEAFPAPAGSQQFGRSVSVHGDWAVIGDPAYGEQGENAGAAYIYRFSDGRWEKAARLTASDGQPGDGFGCAVAIRGDYVLVGKEAAAAYLFRRDGARWVEQTTLVPVGGVGFEQYCRAVALDGNYALVGAHNDSEKDLAAGAVFLYDLSTMTPTATEETPSLPESFVLHQNYPNPFNPVTTISFSQPTAAYVRLNVYDVLGRHVATLADASLPAGTHAFVLDARDLSSGVYVYQVQAGSYVSTKRLIVLK